MNDILGKIYNLALEYNVNLLILICIYFFSFIPVYGGAFLILHGSLKKINFNDFLKLRFEKIDLKNIEVRSGLIFFIIGLILPYSYILFFGHNLPIFLYLILVLFCIVSVGVFFKKFFLKNRFSTKLDYGIEKKMVIADKNLQKILWGIYDSSFFSKNKDAPCQQSIRSFNEFQLEMTAESVSKYLLFVNNNIVGLALITSDLLHCTWVSDSYFRKNFPQYYSEKKLYYFMGIAIKDNYRGNRLAIRLLEHIIDDLPANGAMGFDHSLKTNSYIPYFVNIIKQRKKIKKQYLDKQVYYLVTMK